MLCPGHDALTLDFSLHTICTLTFIAVCHILQKGLVLLFWILRTMRGMFFLMRAPTVLHCSMVRDSCRSREMTGCWNYQTALKGTTLAKTKPHKSYDALRLC